MTIAPGDTNARTHVAQETGAKESEVRVRLNHNSDIRANIQPELMCYQRRFGGIRRTHIVVGNQKHRKLNRRDGKQYEPSHPEHAN